MIVKFGEVAVLETGRLGFYAKFRKNEICWNSHGLAVTYYSFKKRAYKSEMFHLELVRG